MKQRKGMDETVKREGERKERREGEKNCAISSSVACVNGHERQLTPVCALSKR